MLNRVFSNRLLDLSQSAVHDIALRLAFMFGEIGEELRFGFVCVRNEFRPGPEGQPANIAIGDARGGPHEAHDLHISLGHETIMAGLQR
jgi:hypothetical protein